MVLPHECVLVQPLVFQCLVNRDESNMERVQTSVDDPGTVLSLLVRALMYFDRVSGKERKDVFWQRFLLSVKRTVRGGAGISFVGLSKFVPTWPVESTLDRISPRHVAFPLPCTLRNKVVLLLCMQPGRWVLRQACSCAQRSEVFFLYRGPFVNNILLVD
jgi:hypothetical protein